MIAISSFRPFTDPDSEYGRNQINAWRTWQQLFSAIVYFNDCNKLLDSHHTVFIPSEPFPRLIELAEYAAQQKEWCAVINADIVLAPRFNMVCRRLQQMPHACCASSFRYEFDPAVGISSATRVPHDNGVDIFIASPDVWRRVMELADDRLRIGTQFWDTFMLSFLNTFFLRGFYDLTDAKVVFHPAHGDRKYGPGFNHNTIKIWGAPIMPHAKVL